MQRILDIRRSSWNFTHVGHWNAPIPCNQGSACDFFLTYLMIPNMDPTVQHSNASLPLWCLLYTQQSTGKGTASPSRAHRFAVPEITGPGIIKSKNRMVLCSVPACTQGSTEA